MAKRAPADPDKFTEASTWFRGRTPVTKAEWELMSKQARRQAFTIAGTQQLKVVQTVFDSLQKAIDKGTPIEAWKKQLKKDLKRGFSRLDPHHLDTAFINANQTAYNTGRYYQLSDPAVTAVMPLWFFDAVLDDRTSQICLECAGTIRRFDDPWWLMHFCPLHHRCRSTVRALTTAMAKRKGGVSKTLPRPNITDDFGLAPPLRAGQVWEPDRQAYDPSAFREYERKQLSLKAKPANDNEPQTAAALVLLASEPESASDLELTAGSPDQKRVPKGQPGAGQWAPDPSTVDKKKSSGGKGGGGAGKSGGDAKPAKAKPAPKKPAPAKPKTEKPKAAAKKPTDSVDKEKVGKALKSKDPATVKAASKKAKVKVETAPKATTADKLKKLAEANRAAALELRAAKLAVRNDKASRHQFALAASADKALTQANVNKVVAGRPGDSAIKDGVLGKLTPQHATPAAVWARNWVGASTDSGARAALDGVKERGSWANAQYHATQKLIKRDMKTLQAKGVIDEKGYVTLYRGVHGKVADSLKKKAVDGVSNMPVRAASSWTDRKAIAGVFAGNSGAIATVKIHHSRVFAAHPYEKQDSLWGKEGEWVILNEHGSIGVTF